MDKQSVESVIKELVVKLEANQSLTELERDIIDTNNAVFKLPDGFDKANLRQIRNLAKYRDMKEFIATHTPSKKATAVESLKNSLTAQLVYLCDMYNKEN